MATSSTEGEIWIIWAAVNLVTSLVSVIVYFHFAYLHYKKSPIFHKKNLWLFSLYLIPLAYILLLSIDPSILFSEVISSTSSPIGNFAWKRTLTTIIVGELLFYFIILVMLIVTTTYFILMFRQKEDNKLRKQAPYFILSSFITFIAIPFELIPFYIFDQPLRFELAIVSFSISGIIIAIGILKENLFDIKISFLKSFPYLLTSFIITWIFMLSEEALQHLFLHGLFEGAHEVVSAIIVVAVIFPIKNASHAITDKIFPQHKKHTKEHKEKVAFYSKQLKQFLEEKNISVEDVLKALQEHFDISIEEREKILAKMNAPNETID